MKSIIEVERLSKRYLISASRAPYLTLRESLSTALQAPLRRLRQSHARSLTLWAIRDINFKVRPGEAVGIIGRNGAGKSTLLKVLSRITEPTSGEVRIYGRTGSLLEVGTGFHPELTGRENIYLNGAILGMKRHEIATKFDEIVDFSEVEQFLDTPVKRYSSGMYMRLAFAVAAHLDPEILIVDEVLAVGDAAFQKKCLGKMGDVAQAGRTVLFVSHNIGAVIQLCDRAIVLSKGQCILEGNVSAAVSVYMNETSGTNSQARFEVEPDKAMQIISVSVTSPEGDVISSRPHTEPFRLSIEYHVSQWSVGSYLCVDVFNETETRLLWSSDVASVEEMSVKRPAGDYVARVTIPGMILAPGHYYFTVSIFAPGRPRAFDSRDRAVVLEITDGGSLLSNFGIRPHAATMIPLSWETTRTDDGSRA